MGKQGGDRRSEEAIKGDNITLDDSGDGRGTSRQYALRRLRKSRPDLHKQVIAGKKSAHKAMKEAGFVKTLTPLNLLKKAGLTAIPCWIADLSDEEAFMQLVLSNAQSELSPLEIGVHALRYVTLGVNGWAGGRGLTEYADRLGKNKGYISHLRQAAEVFDVVVELSQRNSLIDKAQHLSFIHASPSDSWPLLVQHLISDEWSVDDTKKVVARVKDLLDVIPSWWAVDRLSVASLAIEGKAQGLKATFELAGTLAGKLGVVTIYRHEESDVTEEREGRL